MGVVMLGTYLVFNRNCAEALDFYAEIFDGKILEKMTYGEMPRNREFPLAEAERNLILHSRLQIAGSEIMCADSVQPRSHGGNMYVTVTTPDIELVERAFGRLRQGGEVHMALQPSFFALAHGSLRDKYGVNWMFSAVPTG